MYVYVSIYNTLIELMQKNNKNPPEGIYILGGKKPMMLYDFVHKLCGYDLK